MGSTITTSRAIAGVRTEKGQTLYVLFEETYESNVSPKIPSWCCMGFGYLPATLERIFALASSCEGGMLKNRSGYITPEGYIGTWMKELARPLILRHTEVCLKVGNGFYCAIPTANLTEAVDLLVHAGRPEQANELHDTNAITLDLARDTDALLALLKGLHISPWRMIDSHAVAHRSNDRNPALGYNPARGKPLPPTVPTALKLNNDVRLLKGPDGDWRCGGWQYELVGRHVLGLWQAEMSWPGYYRKQIAAFRNALDRAPIAPDGLVVEVDPSETDDAYQKERIEELRQQAGGKEGAFSVSVTQENEYDLTNLPCSCAQWFFSDVGYPADRIAA